MTISTPLPCPKGDSRNVAWVVDDHGKLVAGPGLGQLARRVVSAPACVNTRKPP